MAHRAVNHPYLQNLIEGEFTDPTAVLKDFVFQYLAYSNDFMRYLTATISLLEERDHRTMLIQNLMEEAGKIDEDDIPAIKAAGIKIEWIQGQPHPVLFQRFLDSIGISKDFRAKTQFCDEALIWRRMFFSTCANGDAAQSLGAMGLGTENIVKFIYQQIIKAMDKHLPKVTREQRVFFDLHAAVDDEHGEVIDNIAAEYAQYRRNREPLRNGMLMALNARAAFFDGMLVRGQKLKTIGQNLSLVTSESKASSKHSSSKTGTKSARKAA